MIKNVFLDLDDTIFDFKACERQALSEVLDSFCLSYSDADLAAYSAINDGMWKLLEKGKITREELMTKRFLLFLERYPNPPSSEVFADRYMEALSHTSALIDGAREVLEILSARYDFYAVTNGYERTQTGRIRSANIGGYFKQIFISQVIGAVKPKKEYFDYCTAHIEGFRLSDTVLIGDSPTSDIAGGKAYGLFSIRYNPAGLPDPEDIKPDRTVSSLYEIPILLASL